MRQINEVLREAARVLQAAGVENPAREARWLLSHATGLTPEDLLRDSALPVETAAYTAMVRRRAAHEPLAFIVGRRGFWSLDLAVSPATLIPRPDSETLIEAALDLIPDRGTVGTVLDLGTGTGCLLLAALTEFPRAWGLGVDASAAATELALKNARTAGLGSRSCMLCGSWGQACDASFDLILCNPPYIESDQLALLAPEVADHEPHSALDGGSDGLLCYRQVLPDIQRLLAPRGLAVLELGQGQADAVTALAVQAGLDPVVVRQDLAGIPRALGLRMALPRKNHLAPRRRGVNFM